METSPKTQIVDLLKQSERILILTHEDPDADAAGSALALRLALLKMNKKPDVILTGEIKPMFNFLPGLSEVKHNLPQSNDLVITVDTRQTGEELKLGYRKFPESRQIKIIVTPPKGSLQPEDVQIERSTPKYDLIIILDTGSLKLLGEIADSFTELFYEVPTVAIDHHPTNNHYAKINWVDMTATSTAEMLVALIESISRDEPLLDEEIATCLLTGIIGDTGQFQNQNTSPKSLTVAAQLVASGAKHQEIIEAMRTKSLAVLKLWGKALARVKEEPEARFIWSALTEEDCRSLGLEPGSHGLMDELLKTVGQVDFALMLTERHGMTYGKLRSVKPSYDVSELAKIFGGGGHKPAAGFRVEGAQSEQASKIIEAIKNYQQGTNGSRVV